MIAVMAIKKDIMSISIEKTIFRATLLSCLFRINILTTFTIPTINPITPMTESINFILDKKKIATIIPINPYVLHIPPQLSADSENT